MDDLIVLVDEKNMPLGTAPKLESHNSNTPLHRGFSLFLFNKNRHLLLQQRSKLKKTWPLVWSNSCCGHPMIWESSVVAAKRRLVFELGIKKATIYEIDPLFRYKCEKSGILENEICPVLVGFSNQPPNINPSEVEKIEWIDWDKFLKRMHANPQDYSPWCVLETNLLSSNKKFLDFFSQLIP